MVNFHHVPVKHFNTVFEEFSPRSAIGTTMLDKWINPRSKRRWTRIDAISRDLVNGWGVVTALMQTTMLLPCKML